MSDKGKGFEVTIIALGDDRVDIVAHIDGERKTVSNYTLIPGSHLEFSYPPIKRRHSYPLKWDDDE